MPNLMKPPVSSSLKYQAWQGRFLRIYGSQSSLQMLGLIGLKWKGENSEHGVFASRYHAFLQVNMEGPVNTLLSNSPVEKDQKKERFTLQNEGSSAPPLMAPPSEHSFHKGNNSNFSTKSLSYSFFAATWSQ